MLAALVLCACSESPAPAPAAPAKAEGGKHVHSAPRGGLLIVVEEEYAHIELLLDREQGELVAYLLGPHAHTAVRTATEELRLTLASDERTEDLSLVLRARANPLSGETVGDSSQFSVQHADLSKPEHWRGRFEQVQLRGQTYTDVGFELGKPDEHAH